MLENKFEIYVFSKDKKEDYHFRPKNLSNKAFKILAKTGFEKLIEGPLAEGRTEVPKCAIKHIKNDGIYLYIADLETKRTDNFKRPIVISALVYFKGYDKDAIRLFLNIILGRNIIEITTFFDAVFEQGLEAVTFDPKIFENIEGFSNSEIDDSCKERLFEYSHDNLLRFCGIIINKYMNSNVYKDFLIFSGDYLKTTILDETNPEICLYKNYIENRPKNKMSNNLLLIVFFLCLISSLLFFYWSNRLTDSFLKINNSGADINFSNAKATFTKSVELKNEMTNELFFKEKSIATESVITNIKIFTVEVNLNGH